MTDNDIELVVSDFRNRFLIDEIKKGKPVTRKSNKKWRIPGGLCCVYKFELKNGDIKALRIWKTEISESKERSTEIAKHLKSLNSDYFIDFEYIKEAFIFNGTYYPIVLMDWCDGVNLIKYICDNANNPSKIEKLANSILNMISQMHKNGISHGDLHHNNVLVKQDGSVVLIDYDTMFVPQLIGYNDECEGYSGYQHPTARKKNKLLSPKVDYFSELILYLSIRAIARNPSLLTNYSVEEQEKSILFSDIDFKRLKSSNIYNDIKNLGHDFQILLNILELYLSKSDINDLEPFYVIAKQMGLQIPIIESITKRPYIHAKFCNQCGKPYYKPTSNYCSYCGNKKIKYN